MDDEAKDIEDKQDYKVNLIYFKNSGKYYAEGSYRTEAIHIWQVCDEVRAMKKLPGLAGKWEKPILVDVPDAPWGVPQLILPK